MRILLYILLYTSILFCSLIDNSKTILEKKFPDYLIEHSLYKISSKDIKSIQNNVRQKFFRPELNIWEITKSDTSNYYAILDNVKGKSLPITFLVIFDQNHQVYDSEIVKYRESYGGEVKNKNWLNQFVEYNSNSNYKVGDAIDGITGATISVKSVTKGIKKLSILISQIIADLNEK